MKQEDIDKLKELCESNGYYFDFDVISDTAVVAKPKDIWDGVEFCSCVGEIYKIKRFSESKVFLENGNFFIKSQCKPSTEQAYIKQLKKEAFERYGEIKKGEKFTETDGNIDFLYLGKGDNPNIEWDYEKEKDRLFYYSLVVYQQGKWAKKIEKAEVKPDGGDISLDGFYFVMNKEAKKICGEIGHWKVCEYLAKQLEDYLNKKD